MVHFTIQTSALLFLFLFSIFIFFSFDFRNKFICIFPGTPKIYFDLPLLCRWNDYNFCFWILFHSNCIIEHCLQNAIICIGMDRREMDRNGSIFVGDFVVVLVLFYLPKELKFFLSSAANFSWFLDVNGFRSFLYIIKI